jgi:hypothetical protein
MQQQWYWVPAAHVLPTVLPAVPQTGMHAVGCYGLLGDIMMIITMMLMLMMTTTMQAACFLNDTTSSRGIASSPCPKQG